MGWYRNSTGIYLYRQPVAVNNVGGSAGSIDVSILVPPGWGHFWSTIRSDGYDVVMCDADGTTELTYQRSGFVYSATGGTLTLQVDAYSAPGEGTCMLWLYYGNSSQSSDPADSGLTISSAKTGSIDQSYPVRHIISMQPENVGRTSPRAEIHTDPLSQEHLYFGPFDSKVLQSRMRFTSSDGSRKELEEIDYVQFGVESSGSEQAAMMDESETRFVLDDKGKLYVKALVKGGTTGTAYMAKLRAYTIGQSSSRTLLGRCRVSVVTLAE